MENEGWEMENGELKQLPPPWEQIQSPNIPSVVYPKQYPLRGRGTKGVGGGKKSTKSVLIPNGAE